MTIKERIKKMAYHQKVFLIIFFVSYFFQLACYILAGYAKYGWLSHQPFSFFVLGIAVLIVQATFPRRKYMGPFNYFFAGIKRVCLLFFILMFLIFVSRKEKEYLGTAYIADLFGQGNGESVIDGLMNLIECLYNEIVDIIGY